MDDQKNSVDRYLGADIEILVKYRRGGCLFIPVCVSAASPRHARYLVALGSYASLAVKAALALDRPYGSFCATIFTLEVPASG